MIWDSNTIYYLAGILEGEGCFYLQKSEGRNPTFCVDVRMTDEDTILNLKEITGIGRINTKKDSATIENNWKPSWRWTVSNRRDVARVLSAVYPLMSKRRKEKIEEMVNEMSQLTTSTHRWADRDGS